MDTILYTRTFKKIVDKRIESMKEKFNKIFKRLNQKENSNEKASQIRKRFAPKESLKERFNRMFKKHTNEYEEHDEDFTPIEQETGLDGYLKTYRIHGKKYKNDRLFFKELAYLPPENIVELGLDELTFIREIKQKVIELINKQKKPIKLKFTFVCKFIKFDNNNENLFRKIDAYAEPFFHSRKPEVVTESTDLSSLFDTDDQIFT